MTVHKEAEKDKKGQVKLQKVQTAEGWKRQQEALLRERNADDVKERKKRAI